MPETIYDLAVIGWWAAGIFACIWAPKDLKKVLLEKNEKIGKKVLLSWGERCNVSNIDIKPEQDYFWKNKKALYAILKKFSNTDMIDWLESKWVKTHIEDRWRIILHSGKAQELLILLHNELIKNQTEVMCNFSAEDVEKRGDIFFIKRKTLDWSEEYIQAKKVVISTGGKSFAQVGTDGWGYKIAEKFWISLIDPYKGLCWFITKQDLKELSGTTLFLEAQLYDGKKLLYSEYGSFLFTHFWLSWPLVFNGVIRLGEYLRELWISENEITYIKDHIQIKLVFNESNLTKKVVDFFNLDEKNMSVLLDVNDLRTWAEAKVTGWWVGIDDLSNTFESKKNPWLYFAWEVLDLTGKTGGFNLQVAWSVGYIIGKSLDISW
jgi:predicted flavoprotein YhiN